MKKIGIIIISVSLVLTSMVISLSSVKKVEAANAANPDFGPNVIIFDPTSTNVQSQMDTVFNQQYMNQFGNERYAFLFKPGNYNVNTNLGYYTTVAGLGQNPQDVVITGGVGAINQNDGSGGLNNFWRGMENFTINPTNQGSKNFWGVSQASPIRRLNINGDLVLSDPSWSGFVSGGFISDTKISGTLFNISQQQWLTRNSSIGSESNGVWNQVFAGVNGAPAANFPPTTANANPYTVLDTNPEAKEKPYLYIDSNGLYNMFVPSATHNAKGTTWESGSTPGTSISLDQFYIAHPSDTAQTINDALQSGLNLIFTPGIYNIDQTINITRNDTIVYGMGMATLRAVNGVTVMKTADTTGVDISGLMFEAGAQNSASLLEIGQTQGSATVNNPNATQDVFFRVGGAQFGQVTNGLVVNSAYTILDNTWVWRADHGDQVGWTVNKGDTGVVVNGDYVSATGFFVEHFEKYQVIWNGEHGKTIMFQNEIPYDVPDQASWTHDGINGYAAYKVADSVKFHEGYGLGSYCFFNTNPDVHLAHSFEVPRTPGVTLYNIVTVSLNNKGTIDHLVNDLGEATNVDVKDGATVKYLAQYPIAQSSISISTLNSKTNKTMIGATYEVRDVNDTVVASFTTGDKDVYTSPLLRYGTYKVIQLSVPNGYQVDSTPREIILKEDSQAVVNINYLVGESTGTITVYAVDRQNQSKDASLSGAVFEVYNEQNILVDTKTTNSPVIFTLPVGKYTIKEVKAPNGYKLNTTPLEVTVTAGNNQDFMSLQDLLDSKTTSSTTKTSQDQNSANTILPDTGK